MCAAISAIFMPFFFMFGHLFTDARASMRMSASEEDSINSKHLIHTPKCFGAAGPVQGLWMDPFALFSH
jgi:hypothetical protein